MTLNLKISSSIKDISIIEKSNNTNYDNWVFKLEILLIKEDLFKYVTEETPATPDDTWVKNNAKTRASIYSIYLCIDNNHIVHIKKLQTRRTFGLHWGYINQLRSRLRKLYSQKLSEGGGG